jgi:probable addiction module antidote protein/putative addiction module killer protein
MVLINLLRGPKLAFPRRILWDTDVEIRQTETFRTWMRELRDRDARGVILHRASRLALGLTGDIKPVGGGVSELRGHVGPGYRAYLARRGAAVVVLPCGGGESTQARDIARAKAMAAELEEVVMPLATTPFDAAEFLDTPEARAAFLNDALATGDAAEINQALGILARALGMTAVAREAGLGRESLYKALREGGNPEFATVVKVVNALGLRLAAVPAQG